MAVSSKLVWLPHSVNVGARVIDGKGLVLINPFLDPFFQQTRVCFRGKLVTLNGKLGSPTSCYKYTEQLWFLVFVCVFCLEAHRAIYIQGCFPIQINVTPEFVSRVCFASDKKTLSRPWSLPMSWLWNYLYLLERRRILTSLHFLGNSSWIPAKSPPFKSRDTYDVAENGPLSREKWYEHWPQI
jgi:hypothetical protein